MANRKSYFSKDWAKNPTYIKLKEIVKKKLDDRKNKKP